MIGNVIVEQYFQSLNAEDFQTTANLFALEGVLCPPFQEAIVGREAIALYLQEEAKGIKLFPLHHANQPLENGGTEHTVTGKVQTAFFCVNAMWKIDLSPASEIGSVKVKLMASIVDLLALREKKEG